MEEIKQKAREELKELFPLEYLRNEIDNFGYASLENWIEDILSQAVQAEHDRWANQTANAHDNKIREITLQKRDGSWRLAIMHLPTEQRESVIKTFDELLNKINI